VEPRKPTDEEKGHLAICLSAYAGMGIEEAVKNVNNATIVVVNGYLADAARYSEKVMMVIWSGGPEFHEVYVWRDNLLERVPAQFP
jgi:hypothetical protein